jgi:chromosome segregation ATPase
MEDPKTRIKKIQTALGNAYSDINILTITNTKLKTDNDKLIIELKKSNELLTRAENEIVGKVSQSEEIDKLLDGVENSVKRLQDKIDELKVINADLVAQNEELKTQSSSIYTKSLAILGTFAIGA